MLSIETIHVVIERSLQQLAEDVYPKVKSEGEYITFKGRALAQKTILPGIGRDVMGFASLLVDDDEIDNLIKETYFGGLIEAYGQDEVNAVVPPGFSWGYSLSGNARQYNCTQVFNILAARFIGVAPRDGKRVAKHILGYYWHKEGTNSANGNPTIFAKYGQIFIPEGGGYLCGKMNYESFIASEEAYVKIRNQYPYAERIMPFAAPIPLHLKGNSPPGYLWAGMPKRAAQWHLQYPGIQKI